MAWFALKSVFRQNSQRQIGKYFYNNFDQWLKAIKQIPPASPEISGASFLS